MNEFYEFVRILAYPVGATGLIYLSVMYPKVRLALYAVICWFLLWTCLLFVQVFDEENYRMISNNISTPTLVVIVVLIWGNIWVTRKE